MAKLSGTSVRAGQQDALTQQAAAQGPVSQLQERVPQASAPQSFDDLLNAPEQGADVASIAEGAVAAAEETAQIEGERIAPLPERARDTAPREWDFKGTADLPSVDGGLKARAQNLANDFAESPPVGLTPRSEVGQAVARGQATPVHPASIAEAEAEAVNQPGSLIAAFNRSGSVTSTTDPNTGKFINTVDPLMLYVGSAVTESFMAGDAFTKVDEETGKETGIDPSEVGPITRAQGSEGIGKDIHREYSRIKNAQEGRPTDEYTDLSREEANTLGNAFKAMYAKANPDLIQEIDGPGRQKAYQLTQKGIEAMRNGSTDRKRLFPKVQVRPSKVATKTGQLPGEVGRTVVKKKSGAVKRKHVDDRVLQEAARNLNEVPNVVDARRMRILFATALPVLAGSATPELAPVFGEINNMGPSKAQDFAAGEKAAIERGDTDYNAAQKMEDLQAGIANQIRSIAMERNGTNHLTYFIQSATGRVTPQQLHFNPTTSKAVRFVTRNVVPAKAAPDSRISRNLEQMYAMMLVPKSYSRFQDKKGRPIKVDALLPEHRIEAFNRAAPQLEKWGDRLSQLLDESMTESEAEAIAAAIEAGTPMGDPNFPEVRPLGLDPSLDGDLIKAIAEKGEDGPHFIDGLIDAARYIKAKRDGRPYQSYFNAYVDGKTNGIASNALQVGSENLARATGVMRTSGDYLLDDGDIRDQLQDDLIERLRGEGFPGDLEDVGVALHTVAEALFRTRDLNKATTMTFSYGKEMASFKKDVEEFLGKLYEAELNNPSSGFVAAYDTIRNHNKWGKEKMIETLHAFYIGSLESRMDPIALKNRKIMRSAATLHAITDQLFTIKSATGFEIAMGGTLTEGFEDAPTSTYQFEGKPREVAHYEQKFTSAAEKFETDDKGVRRGTPGQLAYGQSVTSPIQSLDAATVALSVSGDTWKKMKAASNGNPYVHTIYDAFKFDAMGFDVGVAEVNKNWLDAGMNWSYLEETFDSTQEKMTQWHKEMQQLPQNTPVDVSSNGDYRVVGYLLGDIKTLQSKLKNLMEDEGDAQQSARAIMDNMRTAGYDGGDTMTVAQLRTFVKLFSSHLNVSKRLTSAINTTNERKKKLRRKIQDDKVLQYYAH